MVGAEIRPVAWVGSSYRDYRAFPDPVQDSMGYALYRAQKGGMHESAKPLKGFGGAGVLEIVDRHDGNSYRVVYAVRYASAIYALHAFQKKAKRGIRTPKAEIETVRRRLRIAEAHHKGMTEERSHDPQRR